MRYPEQETAAIEGWGLFEAAGSSANDDGRREFQLQKDDGAQDFLDEEMAWLHVVRKSNNGSAYHRYTLLFLREESPAEFEDICRAALASGLEVVIKELPYEPEEL